VPENIFSTYVRETCSAGKELTSANLMRIAKQWGTRDSSRTTSRNGKNGHTVTVGGRMAHAYPRNIDGDSLPASLLEIVGELQNHFQVLRGALEPVLESEEGDNLKAAERRIMQYLLTEINRLLQRLQVLESPPCSCAKDRRLY
jgi:hypothetical protein